MQPARDEPAPNPDGRLRDSVLVRDLVWNLPGPVYVMTASGRILDGNPAFLALIGASSVGQAVELQAGALWADSDRRSDALEEIGRTGKLRDFECELTSLDGTTHTVLDTCYAAPDTQTGESILYGVLVDISERKRAENELRKVAVRDALTGCYNRRHLEELAAELDEGQVWGAILVDIDHFKDYNDQFGHKAGDDVLVRLARFMTQLVRPDDAVIRLGGDEFLILLFGKDAAFVTDVSRRFTETAPKKAPVPFSLGWAVRDGKESLEETIARADEELIHVRVQERRYSQLRRSGGFHIAPPS